MMELYMSISSGKHAMNEEVCKSTVIHKEQISKAKAGKISEDDVATLVRFFSALGDQTRIRILHALSISELCVCDLCELLSMQQSAVSHQLKTLRMSDLVRTRRDGKVVYYSLADSHVKEILAICVDHLKHFTNE
jgi:DNA-binding transcriptional ArsR family regulator